MPKINGKVLRALPVMTFAKRERTEIVRRIESAFGWLDRMAADHAAAARLLPKLNAAILAEAFCGKLVPQDPNDEPAAKLLERVKVERDVTAAKSARPRGRPRVHRLQTDGITTGLPEIGKAELTVISTSSKGGPMPKSRHDKDVSGKPYLATIVKQLGDEVAPEALFARSNLELVDFYRQLDFECAQGWLQDNNQGLVKAA
jgi:type I restriction enzyme S subunit